MSSAPSPCVTEGTVALGQRLTLKAESETMVDKECSFPVPDTCLARLGRVKKDEVDQVGRQRGTQR